MKALLGAGGRALFGARARLRWLHLILGGALLMPYWLVGTVAVGPLGGAQGMFSSVALQFGAYGIALPIAAATALFPLVRPLSVAAARALCGVPAERFADGAARSRAARLRTSAWYTLHLGLGALVSGASLALPPFAVTLIMLPFFDGLRDMMMLPEALDRPWATALFPLAGTAMLLALAGCAAAAGALLARQAPVLLGPTPSDRLAAAERRATELAERNRLARELHDSVGHALSAVTLQAGAARKVLDSDVEFVREALAAIEETTRRTVGELDSVLGLLRQDDHGASAVTTGPALDTLDGLLSRSGVQVSLTADGDLTAVPAAVSREAYRIVQEGLSNALRHAGASPVTLWIALRGEELEITMENPLPDRAPVVRPGGGRGVRGMSERAALLGGQAQAGPQAGPQTGLGAEPQTGLGAEPRSAVWRLSARLPLAGRR
ncbi:histidine kinase [Streptomyces sp. NBC_01142]|uniref:sensor histidine kinase n=1 Tax=Streptomyces sp. NBC_01142 TaxID=2975865 RepID=UPI00224F7697|nr:histidine kinase [Streptomyces sp. NBC_01142]MCX4822233.1 histidine kinase [Streptomyces sp. NBC_01142]